MFRTQAVDEQLSKQKYTFDLSIHTGVDLNNGKYSCQKSESNYKN